MTIVEFIGRLEAMRQDYGDDAMVEVRNGAGGFDYVQEISVTRYQKPQHPLWVIFIDA